MDPLQPPPSTATAAARKLRLMCSYGGQIAPRPNSKSLFYAGGDTRIITVPATAAGGGNLTLSSVSAHLAAKLHVCQPFSLKYQLPNHDLDSLISVSTDEDLLIMLEEHHRLSAAAATTARIRLFLFFRPPEFMSRLKHPKTESWFVDALKSAKINVMQSQVGSGSAESVVLETSSSFGSTSSSASSSNLPVRAQLEDDPKVVNFSAPESIANDNSVAPAVSHLQPGTYQDALGPVVTMENKVSTNPFESDKKIFDSSTVFEMHKTGHASGFPLSLQVDEPHPPQNAHVPLPHYLAVQQNLTGAVPLSSYYVINSPVPQQQLFYQPNQLQPIYYMPVQQPYTLPVQDGLIRTAPVGSSHPPIHLDSSFNPAQKAYKVTAASPVPEVAPQIYRTMPMTSSLVTVPCNETCEQAGSHSQMNHQAQSVGVTLTEPANCADEFDDDPLRAQIYKTQPPAPPLPSQYQTMSKATTVLLSEALAQLHTDNMRQQQQQRTQPQ